MNDELLIRRLIWQNGLYCGLLAMTTKALGAEIDCDECVKLAQEADRMLNLPLPVFLADQPAETQASAPA